MAASIVQSIGNLVNTTLSSSTYTEASSFGSALKANSLPNDLYAGHDWASLSYPEQLWARWYTFIGDPVLATGIMSFLIHEIFYFGRCIPWIFVDKIPYFRKYKLQENKEAASWEEQWACTKYVLFTHFTIELPQIFLFGPTCDYFGLSTHHVPFPSLKAMASQIVLFFFIEDFYHYWAHRALHWGPLYKKIHKLHHTYSAPFGLAAEYAHPLEILILGLGTIGGPFLYCVLSGGNLHIITVYLWIVLRLFQAVDAHSGYDFPWSLNKIFPLWAGADHHDYHHEATLNCYSTSFRHMDWLFGTDRAYHKKRSAQAEAKKLAAAAAKTAAVAKDAVLDAGKKVVDAANKQE